MFKNQSQNQSQNSTKKLYIISAKNVQKIDCKNKAKYYYKLCFYFHKLCPSVQGSAQYYVESRHFLPSIMTKRVSFFVAQKNVIRNVTRLLHKKIVLHIYILKITIGHNKLTFSEKFNPRLLKSGMCPSRFGHIEKTKSLKIIAISARCPNLIMEMDTFQKVKYLKSLGKSAEVSKSPYFFLKLLYKYKYYVESRFFRCNTFSCNTNVTLIFREQDGKNFKKSFEKKCPRLDTSALFGNKIKDLTFFNMLIRLGHFDFIQLNQVLSLDTLLCQENQKKGAKI